MGRHLLALILAGLVGAAAWASTGAGALPGANGLIVFQKGAAGAPFSNATEIWTAELNGKLKRLTHNGYYDGNPAWSPEGRRIAFESTRSGDMDIWVMDAQGKHAHAVTFSQGEDENPAWSPDGRRIVFQTNRLGNWDLYVMDADGKHQQALVTGTGDQVAPSWSPDGKRIVYSNAGASGSSIWSVGVDGSDKRQLTTAPGISNDPTYSPDGTHIAF